METSRQAATARDVAKLFRVHAKKAWPKCKFSVTSTYNSLTVSLMSAPFSAWVNLDDPNVTKKVDFEKLRNPYYDPEDTIRRGEMQVNKYHIQTCLVLSDEAKEVLQNVVNFINQYHWSESDAMSDYYNTNFYFHIQVGKWNKKFVQTA